MTNEDEQYMQALAILCGSPAVWDSLQLVASKQEQTALLKFKTATDLLSLGQAKGYLESANNLKQLRDVYKSYRSEKNV